MMYIYTKKYYSAIKNSEVLIHAITWMKFKNIMLSKRNQLQKNQYYIKPLNTISRIGKLIETENILVIA